MKNWFHNLKVAQKLMLISVFFVMPDSVMLYLFITGINANIQFARMEQKGSQYQRPLEALLELLPEDRQLALRAHGGDAAALEQLRKKQTQIDSAFDVLEEVDGQIGTDLQFTDEGLAKRKREHYRARTVRAEWDALKKGLKESDPKDAAAQHDHLVADIRMMITHSGDMSNLILDPDLDSYYLMDATLLSLPQTQDRLAEVMAHGEAVLGQPAISNQERQRFAIYAQLLKEADLDRINGSVQTALNEDRNFYGVSPTFQENVPPVLKNYLLAAQAFIDLTNRIVNSEKVDVTAGEFLKAGQAARDASFKLWTVADSEEYTLLQNRIESYQNRRTRSLLVAACALLAAIGFVTFITRSISGPLKQQAAELKTANAALQAEIVERKRAEKEMEIMHANLLEVSRQAGMAEVATGVLHNVGNVLNSVNVSTMLISDRLSKSRVAHLSNVSTLLRENDANLGEFLTENPKGKMLPGFIHTLAERLGVEQAEIKGEVEGLAKNIAHIKEIVSVQQNYAKVSGVIESLAAPHLVEDALEMNGAAFERHRIAVIREYADVPLVRVDKHKVLQILINVIRNAKYAVSESSNPEKKITVRIGVNGNNRVKIAIADTGIGIAKENLSRIFAHGFTTKNDGHGFGLHSSALAAAEIGGSLLAHSDGPGRGATFTLELPMQEKVKS